MSGDFPIDRGTDKILLKRGFSMEKKDARRKRRAEGDLRPLLQKRRNEFFSYAYVGDPEVMMSLFPDCDFKRYPDYFGKIQASVFNDPKVIKDYGKKLKELRTKMNCTLQCVADYIGIDYQALFEIEEGKRKKIDRSRLLLLCAFYQRPPEVLLGLSDDMKEPMQFFSSSSRDRAFYIVDHMAALDRAREMDIALLMQFFRLSESERRVQQKMVAVFRNAPAFKILSYTDATKKAATAFSKKSSVPTDDMIRVNKACGYALFEDMDKVFPDLIDVFISITASDYKTRRLALLLLQVAGFCDNEIPHC